MQARLIAALAALLCAFASGVWVQSYRTTAKHNAELVAAQDETAAIKRGWDSKLAEQRQEYANEISAINADRDALLERVRKRPGRLPQPARAACTGSTGAELSAEDGSFLVGIAKADSVAAHDSSALMDRLGDWRCQPWRYAQNLPKTININLMYIDSQNTRLSAFGFW